MPSTRDEALAVLGLAHGADAAAVQRTFERLARRYPQAHFPDRFRRLLEARDRLLDAGRLWREQVESRTLDLTWAFPHLRKSGSDSIPSRRAALQDMLRAGYLAETLEPSWLSGMPAELPNDVLF